VYLPDLKSYKLEVEALSSEDMPVKVFVKQRIRNFARETTDDIFVAVCTPTQLEDFGEDSPEQGTTYFRTNKIELVARTPEMILDVFNSLVYEVKKLVIDLNALDELTDPQMLLIDEGGVFPIEPGQPIPLEELFWKPCEPTVTIPQINNLTLLEAGWHQMFTANAENWAYSLNENTVSITISGKGTVRFRCCYKNESMSAEYPYLAVGLLNVAFNGYKGLLRMTFNDVEMFKLEEDTEEYPPFAYYPADITQQGFLGKMEPGQTGMIDIVIESDRVLPLGAEISFQLGYD
jgi:hypothetical protein